MYPYQNPQQQPGYPPYGAPAPQQQQAYPPQQQQPYPYGQPQPYAGAAPSYGQVAPGAGYINVPPPASYSYNMANMPPGGSVPPAPYFMPPPQQPQMMGGAATVPPYMPFNPNDDAARVRTAMKGIGTDEIGLIEVICKRTFDQRHQIAVAFNSLYGKNLLKEVQSELSGDMKHLFTNLLNSQAEMEADHLHDAIQGYGTKEHTLIDIVCTKTAGQMAMLKDAYKRMYGKDPTHECGEEAHGHFRKLIKTLMTANRSEQPADFQRAQDQARSLYRAGAGRWGTDEDTFNRIFATESFTHLRAVFDEYHRTHGKDIVSVVQSEMQGDEAAALVAIAEYATQPAAYWARRLHEAMKGAGTGENTLIRIIALRCEVDMMMIKQVFQTRYGQSLETAIRKEVSRDFKRALLCLVGDPTWAHT